MTTLWHPTHWRFTLRDAAGAEMVSAWRPNLLCAEGAYAMLDTFFRNGAASTPISFELGLTDSALSVASTAAALTGEPYGGGYVRIPITRDTFGWPTLAIPSSSTTGTYQLICATQTFVAGNASIGPFQNAFICAVLNPSPGVTTRALVIAASTGWTTTIGAGYQLDVSIAFTSGA